MDRWTFSSLRPQGWEPIAAVPRQRGSGRVSVVVAFAVVAVVLAATALSGRKKYWNLPGKPGDDLRLHALAR